MTRKRRATERFVFFVRVTQTGDLYRAHLEDDNTTIATGETPILAMRNLCQLLADEDARAQQDTAS